MTRTTSFKRIMCCLLALLVLCTCVVKPLEAKAAVAATIGTIAAIGVVYAMCAGVLLNPKTAEQVAAVSNSLVQTLESYADTDAKREELAAYLASWHPDNWDDAPDDDTPHQQKVRAARWILSAIAAWIGSVVVAGGVEVEGEAALEGYAYYNGRLLPDIEKYWADKELRQYAIITFNDYFGYQLHLTSTPLYWRSGYIVANDSTHCLYYQTNKSFSTWELISDFNYGHGSGWEGALIWSNYDVYGIDYSMEVTDKIYLEASPATSSLPYTVETLYIDGVIESDENGEIDSEEIEKNLPAVIDPSTLLYNTQKEDLNQAVQEVMGQLASGQMTYDQYMESIQAEPEDNPEDNPEDETQPGTSPDPTPDGSGDAEVKGGLRKLVDFFTGTTYVQSPLQAMNFGTLFDLFPFNIPAGIYQAINFWKADAEAPKLVLPTLAFDGEKVTGDEFTVDLAEFPGMSTIAALIRAGNLILFGIGLLLITRKVTKW